MFIRAILAAVLMAGGCGSKAAGTAGTTASAETAEVAGTTAGVPDSIRRPPARRAQALPPADRTQALPPADRWHRKMRRSALKM